MFGRGELMMKIIIVGIDGLYVVIMVVLWGVDEVIS